MLVTIALVPGPILWTAYKAVIYWQPGLALSLYQSKQELSTLIAGICFTMMGMLAAIITILFAFVGTPSFRKFQRDGYLDSLFLLYFVTIGSLFLTVGLSVFGFSKNDFPAAFNLMMAMFFNNIVQIGLLTLVISQMAKRASRERS